MAIELPPGYKPSEDEEYMCERQLEYFRIKLENWRNELFRESARLLMELKETELQEPDMNDRASNEMDQVMDMHSRDRIRQQIEKIDAALRKDAQRGAEVNHRQCRSPPIQGRVCPMQSQALLCNPCIRQAF